MKKDNFIIIVCGVLATLYMLFFTSLELLVVSGFFLEFVLFYLLKRYLGNSMSFVALTLPSFFIFSYIVLMIFPSLYIFSEMDHPIRFTFLIVIHGSLFTLLSGIIFIDLVFAWGRKTQAKYHNLSIYIMGADKKYDVFMYLIFITFIPVLAMYVLTSDFIPLVEVIKSYPTEIDEQTLRFSENRLPYLVQISFELFRRILLPLAVIYAYVKSNLYHGRWTLYFWISFVLTAIVCAATLDRGPIIILIVMIMFVRYFVLKKTDLRIYFFGLFLVSFFGALISLLQYQREILFDVFIQYSFYILGWRIFIDPVSMAGLAFEQFNASTGFLYGESVRLFSLIVPSIEYIDSQGGSNHREWSAAPATFVGDLWRNFSWVGVIIGTFLLGAVYQFIQIFFIRNQNIVTICAFIILMMYPLFIIHGNMFGIVTTMIFIVGLILSVIGSTITLPNCKVYANDNHSKN